MARVALQVPRAVRTLRDRNLLSPLQSVRVLAHQLGARGALVVVGRFRYDAVVDEMHSPLLSGIDERALIQLAFLPFTALGAVRITQQREVSAFGRGCRTGCAQGWIGVSRSVAVDTSYLDRLRHFAIDIAIAMIVAGKVAIHTMHALIHVDRGHVNRLLELLRILITDRCALGIEQCSVADALEDGADIPTMAVIVRKLGVVQRRIQLTHMLDIVEVRPLAAWRGSFGVALGDVPYLIRRGVLLFLRPHSLII